MGHWWNPDITKSSVSRTIFFTLDITRYMKNNLDITNTFCQSLGSSLTRGSTVSTVHTYIHIYWLVPTWLSLSCRKNTNTSLTSCHSKFAPWLGICLVCTLWKQLFLLAPRRWKLWGRGNICFRRLLVLVPGSKHSQKWKSSGLVKTKLLLKKEKKK